MFIVDDILAFPVTSILWVFREIGNAAEQELQTESADLTSQLSDLYMMLETGQLSEAEFEAREKEILDRMDVLSGQDEETAGRKKIAG